MLRSVRSIVILPARTGSERRSRIAVTQTPILKRGTGDSFFLYPPVSLIVTNFLALIPVTIKLRAPRIDETPARWREKMARSTEGPACARFPERGG